MSIFRGSVTVGKVILFIDASLAWDQVPQWRKRRKKSARKASREAVWGEENVAPPFPPPQATARLASFADIFPILTPFFAFFPYCGAWSRANDGYTMTLEKLPLKDKIIALCLQHIIVNYKTKMNIEKLWGQKVFQNHNKNLFQSSSSLFIPASFCIFWCHLYLLLIVFERLF